MSYTEWLIYKLIGMVVLAFIWGIFCGVTGRPLWRARSDKEAGQ